MEGTKAGTSEKREKNRSDTLHYGSAQPPGPWGVSRRVEPVRPPCGEPLKPVAARPYRKHPIQCEGRID